MVLFFKMVGKKKTGIKYFTYNIFENPPWSEIVQLRSLDLKKTLILIQNPETFIACAVPFFPVPIQEGTSDGSNNCESSNG